MDITCCDGITTHSILCPLANKCWRYLAPKDPQRQSFFAQAPYNSSTNTCEYHWLYDAKVEMKKKRGKK